MNIQSWANKPSYSNCKGLQVCVSGWKTAIFHSFLSSQAPLKHQAKSQCLLCMPLHPEGLLRGKVYMWKMGWLSLPFEGSYTRYFYEFLQAKSKIWRNLILGNYFHSTLFYHIFQAWVQVLTQTIWEWHDERIEWTVQAVLLFFLAQHP